VSPKRKSEKRQRPLVVAARVTQAEKAKAEARAAPFGGTSAMIRHFALDEPLPRHALEAAVLMRLLGVWQGFRGDFGHALSNLNQLTKYANLDRILEASIAEAAQEVMRGIATLEELRLVTLQDMGYERKPKKPKPPKDE
jgi:hypothetical protein